MVLSEINIYPVKSLAGISLPSCSIEDYGLRYDRKWMLIDEHNQFLSQRTIPIMALIKTSLSEDFLEIFVDKMPKEHLKVPLVPDQFVEEIEVTIWHDQVKAWHLAPVFDQWFSELLNVNCRLVYMPSTSQRLVDPRFAHQQEIVGFADGFPFLLIGEGSLQDLNNRLQEPVPMHRFRPNLVIAGTKPYDEDLWNIINIGTSRFEVAKPSARCSVITIDNQTAVRGKEPLKTLSEYRVKDNKVMFGQNLLCQQGSQLSVGDKVEVISYK